MVTFEAVYSLLINLVFGRPYLKERMRKRLSAKIFSWLSWQRHVYNLKKTVCPFSLLFFKTMMSSQEVDNSETTRTEYIDNGLLFFLFNKVDCMNQEDLLCICSDFYSEEEIELAVSLLFCKYGCPEEQKEYRGAKKRENNLRQMMALMCQKPAPKGVTFCITKCTQVPPITMDHIDMGTVMKLFSSLRAEVKLLSSSNVRIDERLTRIERERESVPIEEVINDNGKNGMSAQEVIDLQARLLKKVPTTNGKEGERFF